MKLKDLCGRHIFSGCELTEEPNTDEYYFIETCNVCLFTLDGITYKAIEDPSDGYRSYCGTLTTTKTKPRFSFKGVEVDCYMKEDDLNNLWNQQNDILVVEDINTGKIILEVGTGNIGDYYPYCHFSYHPENMFCNIKRKKKK